MHVCFFIMKYKCCDYSFPDWLRAAGANLCKQISSTLMGYAHIGVTGASCHRSGPISETMVLRQNCFSMNGFVCWIQTSLTPSYRFFF